MSHEDLTLEQIALLRPFDAEKAKQGHSIYCIVGASIKRAANCTYVAGPDILDRVCVSHEGNRLEVLYHRALRLNPLFWLEGKPVYEGDELYYENFGKVKVDKLSNAEGVVLVTYGKESEHSDYLNILTLSWEDSRVEKEGWINLFRTSHGVVLTSKVFDTEEQAKERAAQYGQGFSSLEILDTVKITWKE